MPATLTSPSVMNYPNYVELSPYFCVVTAGSFTTTINTAHIYNGYAYSDDISSVFTWNFINLKAGTYSFKTIGQVNSDAAILSVYIDGVKVGQIDYYAAGTTQNAIKSITGITITSGNHTIQIKTESKHASSGSYIYRISAISLERTA